MILYRGASLLDPSAEVMVVATLDSDNRKTGPMTQLWIMRTDRHPVQAVSDGTDDAICGACAMRGTGVRGRVCYVRVQHAPAAVFRAFRGGQYRDLSRDPMPRISYLLRGHKLRLGAYGDPAAVAYEWWRAILRRTAGWTGYTHHWRTCDRRMAELVMASVDTLQEMQEAGQAGYRTYRVRTTDSPVLKTESLCPASDEMQHRTTCDQCLLCNGKEYGDQRRSVVILAHGAVQMFTDARQLGLFEGVKR